MGQTVGSQIFGPWYDIMFWAAGAATFFYFAVGVENMPPRQKALVPALLLNKKFCIGVGVFFALMGVGTALKWW